jgi:hypothetical protein
MSHALGVIFAAPVTGWRRVRRGRPGRLALRLLAAAAVSAGAVAAVGWQPASIAVSTGMLTVVVLTAGKDLAGPSSR